MKFRVLSIGAGVIQICWTAPGPVMSARVKVEPAATLTIGETFHPWPRSRAAFLAAPSTDIPPLPFSPVKFSGLIERDWASERRKRWPRLEFSPSNFSSAADGERQSDIGAARRTRRRRIGRMGFGGRMLRRTLLAAGLRKAESHGKTDVAYRAVPAAGETLGTAGPGPRRSTRNPSARW